MIPTALQLRLTLLGKLGRGPAELVHLYGACVDAGFNYEHCVSAIPEALAALVTEGKAECVQVPSPFTKAEYRVWRIAGSVPMEPSPAAVAVPVREGHISAADYRASGRRK